MSQTKVDPPELRRFARFLFEVADEITLRRRVNTQKFDELRRVWSDDTLRRFEPKYNASANELDGFCKAAIAYAHYLEEKAARAERFLSR